MEIYNLITGATFNVGNFFTDAMFALCTVVLLGAWRLAPRYVLRNLVDALLVFVLLTALSVAWAFAVPFPVSELTFPPLFAALGVYALMQDRLTSTDRIARCSTFAAAFVLVVSLTGVLMPAFGALKRLSWGLAVPSLVSYAAMLCLALVIRRFSVEKFSFVPRHFVWLVVAMDVLGAFAGVSFIVYTAGYQADRTDSYASIVLNRYEQAVSQVNLIVDVSFLLLIVLAYLMFYVLSREHDERAELLVTKKSELDNARSANVTRSMYESLREVRHEIKNHDAYMLTLLEAGDIDRLKEFLSTYALLHEEATHYVSTGNPIVDAVVNAKVALARSEGLEIETMIAVPSELPYEEVDVFSLLANMLDNAIEGTCATDREDPGTISLKVMPEAGYYLFVVSNPCDPHLVRRNRAGELMTTKGSRDIHGFGTKVIRRIAEKYDGHARFVVEGETFTASVMLARSAEKEEAL